MAGDSGKKLFVGPRFRRIPPATRPVADPDGRGAGGFAELHQLIERNQRPVTAQILLRWPKPMTSTCAISPPPTKDRFFAELNEIFSDLVVSADRPAEAGAADLAELCPGVTHSLQRLYAPIPKPAAARPWSRRKWPTATRAPAFEANPIERIRDLIEANRNYFPSWNRPPKPYATN